MKNISENNVVLITGAANGIGKATAERFAKEGFRIAAVDINEKGLISTVASCRTYGAEAEYFICDVANDKSVAKMSSLVTRRWKRIDIVVHSAAVGRYAPFSELGIKEWEKMLDVNVLGIVRITQNTLEDMVSQGTGRIIILGSRRGLEPARETSAYSTTKAALIGFSRSLAREVFDKGIQVCYIAPGGVKTDFGGVGREEKDPRYLDPETIAESIVHVASTPAGAWIRELTIIPLEL